VIQNGQESDFYFKKDFLAKNKKDLVEVLTPDFLNLSAPDYEAFKESLSDPVKTQIYWQKFLYDWRKEVKLNALKVVQELSDLRETNVSLREKADCLLAKVSELESLVLLLLYREAIQKKPKKKAVPSCFTRHDNPFRIREHFSSRY
jgi:hypothetical protein